MPAGFSASERERITESLLASGRRLFAAQGLRKTSLEELVRPAGIAKSSFYAFFDSKEALYLDLMLRQAPEVTRPLPKILAGPGTVRQRLQAALVAGVRIASGNPLYLRLIQDPADAAALTRRVGPAEMERARPYVVGPLIDFIVTAQKGGELVDVDPEVVLGVIQAASSIVMHANDYGDRYDDVLELLMRSVAFGLTIPDPPPEGLSRRPTEESRLME